MTNVHMVMVQRLFNVLFSGLQANFVYYQVELKRNHKNTFIYVNANTDGVPWSTLYFRKNKAFYKQNEKNIIFTYTFYHI